MSVYIPMMTERHYWKYTSVSWTQPVLTANGVLGGAFFAVAASSEIAGFNAWKMMDGNANTLWSSSTFGAPQWVIFYNPNALKVSRLVVRNRPSSAEQAFTNGLIQASDNQTDWTELVTFTNAVTSNGATWEVTIPDAMQGFYRYYRIYISGVFSVASASEISITATEKVPVAASADDYDYVDDKRITCAPLIPVRRYYQWVVSDTRYSDESVISAMTSASTPSGTVSSDITSTSNAPYLMWSQSNYSYHPYYNKGSRYNRYTFAEPLAAGRYRLQFAIWNAGSSTVSDHKILLHYQDASSETVWTYAKYGSANIIVDLLAAQPVTAIEYTYSCTTSGKDYGEEGVRGLKLCPPAILPVEVGANEEYDYYVDTDQLYLSMRQT